MEYKGYFAKVDFDEEAEVFFGRIVGITDVVNFEATNVRDLKKEFRDSVDEYLAHCKEIGKEPNKPMSGKFQVRVDPEVHRKISIASALSGASMNKWVEDALSEAAEAALE